MRSEDTPRTPRNKRPAPFAEITGVVRAWAVASRDEPADDTEAEIAARFDNQPPQTESR